MIFPIWIPFHNEWWTFSTFLFIILGFVGFSELSLKKGWMSPEANRKWVHCLVGLSVAISPLIFSTNLQPIALSFIFIILNTVAIKKEIFKGIHSQSRITYGTVLFPFAYLILVLTFWTYPEFLIISLLILAISDPLAAQVGQDTPKQSKFKIWEDEKSFKGSIAFFTSSFIIIYLSTHFLFDYSFIYLFGFSLFTASGATIAEATSCKGTDNVSIPIVSILFLIGFQDNFIINSDLQSQIAFNIYCISLVIIIFSIAYKFKSLSLSGYFGGLIMGIIIILFGGWFYLYPICVFFILSSILSKIVKKTSSFKTKEANRDIIQVYSNGGIGLIICIFDYFSDPNLYIIPIYLASIAAATADTWGTEFGKYSKKRPVSIYNFKTIDHGMSGGITLIGSIGSLLGASVIAFAVWLFSPISNSILFAIIFIGFLASLFDSLLGATVQAKYETQFGEIIEIQENGATLISGYKWLNNDMVNLLNTAFAPILMVLYLILFNTPL